jgi:alkylation response protein AidB-like acyl-CoA dehydrogenase
MSCVALLFCLLSVEQKLIEHAVIRFKLAQMARQVESAHAWLESITYQMKTLSHADQNRILGGPIALLKVSALVAEETPCDREVAQPVLTIHFFC